MFLTKQRTRESLSDEFGFSTHSLTTLLESFLSFIGKSYMRLGPLRTYVAEHSELVRHQIRCFTLAPCGPKPFVPDFENDLIIHLADEYKQGGNGLSRPAVAALYREVVTKKGRDIDDSRLAEAKCGSSCVKRNAARYNKRLGVSQVPTTLPDAAASISVGASAPAVASGAAPGAASASTPVPAPSLPTTTVPATAQDAAPPVKRQAKALLH